MYCTYIHTCPTQNNTHFVPHPAFSSQSAGPVDLVEIMLASDGATLHDFIALRYELELELIQTHMAQKPMLHAEVHLLKTPRAVFGCGITILLLSSLAPARSNVDTHSSGKIP
jgi:hypothetical protein